MGVELSEQETIINIMRTEDRAEIYTSDSTMITKLDRKVKENPDIWKILTENTVSGKVVSKTYSCPKKLVSLRNRPVIGGNSGNTDALREYMERKRTEQQEGE
jgi:hypothetical protein